jgi:cell division protein FtsW (lipid II flippase)
MGFLALTVACFEFALSNLTRWTIYSIAGGVLFTTTMALASAVLDQHERWVDLGGLVQRVSLTIAVRILHA